jgi:hypothetical protein
MVPGKNGIAAPISRPLDPYDERFAPLAKRQRLT